MTNTTYAKQLETIVSAGQWDIPFLDPLHDSIGAIADALSSLELSTGWTGAAADEASIAIRDLSKRFLDVQNTLLSIRKALNEANDAKADAADAEAKLPEAEIPFYVHAAVLAGSTVVWPGLGTLTAELAIQAIQAQMSKDREAKAKIALDALQLRLDTPADNLWDSRHLIDKKIPGTDVNPPWTGDPGGPTGPTWQPTGGGGGGGDDPHLEVGEPTPWVRNYPYTGGPWPEWPPMPPPEPPVNEDNNNHNNGTSRGPTIGIDGNSQGHSGVGGGFGGSGGGIGGALGGGALGTGALGAGAASAAGVGGRLGSSLLGGGPGGAVGAGGAGTAGKGGASMMGGGQGGGGGGGEKDKRANLGLVAPKIEDDEPTAPRSASAGAGGRD